MPIEHDDQGIRIIGYEPLISWYNDARELQAQIYLQPDGTLNVGGLYGGGGGEGGGATGVHGLGDLSIHTGTLASAQAPQFLLLDGSRPMAGNLNVGGHDITNVALVDGVDVSGHAARHESGGADAVDHDSLSGFVVNEHIDHSDVSITAGIGLTGGGTIDASRTLDHHAGDFGDLHTNYAEHAANETITGTWAFASNLTTRNILPESTDAYDLGSSIKLWRKGWLSELEAILFVENSVALLGGWFYIPKYAGTTGANANAVQTSIDLGATDGEMTAGDVIVFRQSLKVEYMTLVSYAGANVWNVTRDVDGSGADTWPAGAPYACFGREGDGRIELNAYDTPRISILKQGATYNAQSELIRLGDLNGLADYTSEEYGIFIGDFAGDKWLAYDQTNSLRIRGDALIDGTVDATKFAVGMADQFFSRNDGLLLLNSDCEMAPTAWTSLRRQTATISGAFHTVAGPWSGSRALMVEEATTNHILNPDFEVDVTTGWDFVQAGTGATRSQNTASAYVYTGSASCRITASSSGNAWLVTQAADEITIANGQSVTAHAQCHSLGGLFGRVLIYDVTNSASRASVSSTLKNRFEHIKASWTNNTGGDVQIRVYLYNTAGNGASIVYYDAVLLETKPYATSFVQDTRAATTLSANASLVGFDYAVDHTVLAWLKLDNAAGTGPLFPAVFHYGDYFTNNSISLMFSASTGQLELWAKDNSGTWHKRAGMDNPAAGDGDFDADTWYLVGYRYDASENQADLIWNGDIGTGTATAWPSANNTNHTLSFGARAEGSMQCNGAVGEAVILNACLTAEQVATLYHRQAPLSDAGAFDAPGVYILDGRFSLATSTSGARYQMDETGFFAHAASGDAAFGLSLADGQSWGGFTMDESDIVLGHNKTGSAAIRWDQSTGKFGFYGDGGVTPQVEIGTDGGLKADGENLKLDAGGIALASLTDYAPGAAIKFGTGQIWGRSSFSVGNNLYIQLGPYDASLAAINMTNSASGLGMHFVLSTAITPREFSFTNADVAMRQDAIVYGGLNVGGIVNPADGQIHFNHATHALRRNGTHIEWHNGTNWVQLD